MLLCDYADSHEQDVIFQWTDRVISSGVSFSEVKIRPDYYRRMLYPMLYPLVVLNCVV